MGRMGGVARRPAFAKASVRQAGGGRRINLLNALQSSAANPSGLFFNHDRHDFKRAPLMEHEPDRFQLEYGASKKQKPLASHRGM